MSKVYVSTLIPGVELQLFRSYGNEVDLYSVPENEDGWKFAATSDITRALAMGWAMGFHQATYKVDGGF